MNCDMKMNKESTLRNKKECNRRKFMLTENEYNRERNTNVLHFFYSSTTRNDTAVVVLN